MAGLSPSCSRPCSVIPGSLGAPLGTTNNSTSPTCSGGYFKPKKIPLDFSKPTGQIPSRATRSRRCHSKCSINSKPCHLVADGKTRTFTTWLLGNYKTGLCQQARSERWAIEKCGFGTIYRWQQLYTEWRKKSCICSGYLMGRNRGQILIPKYLSTESWNGCSYKGTSNLKRLKHRYIYRLQLCLWSCTRSWSYLEGTWAIKFRGEQYKIWTRDFKFASGCSRTKGGGSNPLQSPSKGTRGNNPR